MYILSNFRTVSYIIFYFNRFLDNGFGRRGRMRSLNKSPENLQNITKKTYVNWGLSTVLGLKRDSTTGQPYADLTTTQKNLMAEHMGSLQEEIDEAHRRG